MAAPRTGLRRSQAIGPTTPTRLGRITRHYFSEKEKGNRENEQSAAVPTGTAVNAEIKLAFGELARSLKFGLLLERLVCFLNTYEGRSRSPKETGSRNGKRKSRGAGIVR
jgi:hypothetical protein